MVLAASQRLLPLLALLASPVLAGPYPRDDLHDSGYSYLMPRGCDSYCGVDNQICCPADSVCKTVEGNIATCIGGGGGGGWIPAYTTTWTQTFTSTIMTHWEPAPEPTEGVDCVPKNEQQEACGPICCAGWQQCADDVKGQCVLKPGYEEPSTIVVTTGGKTTTQYSAPYRITGTTTVVETTGEATQTGEPTATTGTADGAATETNEPSGAGGGGGGGLSGGEIAGIVIGAIAGAVLLLLLAFCCIARGLWNACFGRKKKERVDVYEERYSRHGSRHPSAHSRRDHHGGWFGGRFGGRGSDHSEKKSGGKKWLGLAGLAATLFALLNLKKDKKPARKPARSRYSDSYYSYSDATTSPSSSSSGRRTYRSRRTGDGGSRGPPKSYYSGSRSRRS